VVPGDEVAGVAAGGCLGANEADKVRLGAGKGRDIVWCVVAVRATRVCLAATHWCLCILWVQLLDTIVVVRVDNGGDIEVVVVIEAIELDLAQHARYNSSSGIDHVPVACPSAGETLSVGSTGREGGLRDGFKTKAGSEDDFAGLVVLADELDRVVGHDQGRKSSEDGGDLETHVEGGLRLLFI